MILNKKKPCEKNIKEFEENTTQIPPIISNLFT